MNLFWTVIHKKLVLFWNQLNEINLGDSISYKLLKDWVLKKHKAAGNYVC